MTLLVVRHAPVAAPGLCYGHHPVPLAMGAEEAARVVLADSRARGADVVHASPLVRCAEPARLVAAALSSPLHLDPRLAELGMGSWEGRAWADLEREDGPALAAWMEQWTTARPPGGESTSELTARVASWHAELAPDRVHLLVAHAGVVRALAVITAGLSWEAAMRVRVPHLAVRTVDELARPS